MLIRYEVRIGDDIHGIFRVPQNTDLLNDDNMIHYEFIMNCLVRNLKIHVGIMVE